ncbi:hypothetical protein CANTEDRAFT_133279 [Yamadazyma tenuis ATCC 10573]|uniref:Uncharacterized protein n=1 Tax=Candida tenuis (strain ATCC 10573 / BCRC 21748 / CBS 615 / JCM 9827 / NBRC 10315 / NRRL Y-1498 / VKM Y-70) TaxID=590646 RepID=G3AYI2_CANTC|nr:uncharacterized protein CANTEDRAFT_133279 [Yamadazyma tenuis ATCC 10573]EGV65857.1 hypothetical protein CANTEDRAFT_133279 [Yamadazyma tenuis ATCC 10573]
MFVTRLDNRKLLLLCTAVLVTLLTSGSYFALKNSFSIADAQEHYPPGKTHDPGKDGGIVGSSKGGSTLGDTQTSPPDQTLKLQISKISDFDTDNKIVLFPKKFPLTDDQLKDFYSNRLAGSKLSETVQIARFNNNRREDDTTKSNAVDYISMKPESYHGHKITVFDSRADINGDTAKCDEIKRELSVDITDSKLLKTDLESILRTFQDGKSPYYKEMEPYFKAELEKQLQEHTINKYWYRLAGTSVWLSEYGVHMMISRVIYSPKGSRNQPRISLTYCQVFNEKWQELKDVELVVPSNDPENIFSQVDLDGTFFTKVKYPGFLAVPTYQNPDMTDHRFYGPEDPRLMVIQNEHGYEEPLMVYNSYHRKIIEQQFDGETKVVAKLGYYRSMFLCFPWQFQRGKRTIEELPDIKSDGRIYNRAIELRRKGMERLEVQKNWTPFIDFGERQAFRHDKHIYFVYRWSNLEVLRCEITGAVGTTSKCEFVYRMDDGLDAETPVGPVRGGTEMININSFSSEYDLGDILSFPEDSEVWIGFARAHLQDCGCGEHLYRPNFVVLMKDSKSGFYKINTISSFVSLDVPSIGWNLDKPDELCVEGRANVFIPNGISSLSVKQSKDGSFEDYLTLSFSLSDATVNVIHIRNILKSVLGSLVNNNHGYSNDNVDCAIIGSNQFCHDLGESVKVTKAQNSIKNDH